MAEQPFRDLVVLFSAGLGLVLLAGVGWLGRGWPRAARLGAGASITLACGLGPVALGSQVLAVLPVIVTSAVVVVLWTLSSARFVACVQAGLGRLRRPAVRACGLAAFGVVVAAGSIVKFEIEDEAALDRDMDAMMEVNHKPPVRLADESAATDGGRAVSLMLAEEPRAGSAVTAAERKVLSNLGFFERVIRVAPANDVCNCHGWVFTGGRYWLSPEAVQQILEDNAYQPVSDPRPGDLAIYRDAHTIGHTAVVRATGDGQSVLVEGKWGWMGVFLHGAGDSCYGKSYTFYRSNRVGHLLAGLGGPPSGPRLASR